MSGKIQVPELIDNYARSAEGEFLFVDMLRHLRNQGCRAGEDEIYGRAADSEFLFAANRLDEDAFVPRHVFFRGAQFRVTPLEEEVEGGFLVPGHRFMPFASREVFPADARLVLPDGSVARSRTVSVPQEMAMAVLRFYGDFHSLEYLILDYEENAEVLKPPYKNDVGMTVFDFRDYFSESGFQPGDSLMLSVVDWQTGVFSVSRVQASGDFFSVQEWMGSMKLAFEDAMDELGPGADCYEQLSLAFYSAQDDPDCVPLASNPPLSIAAFFNRQEEITVKTVGENALFWEVDEDPETELVLEALSNPPRPGSELDAHFQQQGLSLSETEAEAYMRDALFRGCDKPDEVLARVASGRLLVFPSAGEQDDFHRLWGMLWEDVRKEYSKEGDVCAEARSRFLELNDRCLAVMRHLDRQGIGMEALLENPAFMEFNHLSAMIASMLELFNRPDEFGEVPDNVDAMVGTLGEALDQLIETLKGGGEAQESQVGELAEEDAIYQLKVSLKGAKPPIWRRILIPADMELADLHHAIQASMGWENCHLHQFKKGRTRFQPNPNPDFMGFGGGQDVDSAGIRIGDLLRSEKEKIGYEYDFGDGWEHIILLEKILDPEEGQTYPVCIKGKRACPPEDCGGLWGYYDLLEILGNPKDEGHEGMLEWVGGKIDPEAFELAEANARLKYYF